MAGKYQNTGVTEKLQTLAKNASLDKILLAVASMLMCRRNSFGKKLFRRGIGRHNHKHLTGVCGEGSSVLSAHRGLGQYSQ